MRVTESGKTNTEKRFDVKRGARRMLRLLCALPGIALLCVVISVCATARDPETVYSIAALLGLPVQNAELDICLWLLFACIASVCLVLPLELCWSKQRACRHDGVLGIGRSRRGVASVICSLVLTVVGVVVFAWSYFAWQKDGKPEELTGDDIRMREELALDRLRMISDAQTEYIKLDRDRDGTNSYALFVPHLWQTVSAIDSMSVPVTLIPRELAIACVDQQAIDGYYFYNLHWRGSEVETYDLMKVSTLDRLDYSKEWATLAVPTSETTLIEKGAEYFMFLMDSSGGVWARRMAKGVAKMSPVDKDDQHWIESEKRFRVSD